MTDRHRVDVLIFAEDPGAVNCLAPLPPELAKRGYRVNLYGSGLAPNQLVLLGKQHSEWATLSFPDDILASTNPKLVVVGTAGNPHTHGLKLVAEARAVGITSIGVLDAPMNATYRFRGSTTEPLAYAPDWLLVVD